VIARDRRRVDDVIRAAQATRTLAVIGLGCWIAVWLMFLIVNADFDGEQGALPATIVMRHWERGDDWLREYPDDLQLAVAPGRFVLRAGARVIATGTEAAALDPARIHWLVRWRPRVVVQVADGVSLARVVAAMDTLAAAGFHVAFDADPP
jgi:hypothetical protein